MMETLISTTRMSEKEKSQCSYEELSHFHDNYLWEIRANIYCFKEALKDFKNKNCIMDDKLYDFYYEGVGYSLMRLAQMTEDFLKHNINVPEGGHRKYDLLKNKCFGFFDELMRIYQKHNHKNPPNIDIETTLFQK